MSRIVYHRLASSGPYDVSDKFKIELFYNQRGSTTPIGLKFVISTLLKSKSGAQVSVYGAFNSCHEQG